MSPVWKSPWRLTGNGDGATGFDGIDDIVWRNVAIKRNGRDGSGIDGIALGIGYGSRGITGGIGGDEGGIDGGVRVSCQVATFTLMLKLPSAERRRWYPHH